MPVPVTWLLAILTLTGFNFTFWAVVGLIRFTGERALPRLSPKWMAGLRKQYTSEPHSILPHEVAVVMAAHNEEISLAYTIESLLRILPAENIYIGSDASTDQTVAIAKIFNCNVVDLKPNRGKAKVLEYLIQRFNILDRYKAVLLIDADVIVDKNFLRYALPYFNDPGIVAIAGHAVSRWPEHWVPKWAAFFTAYRIRLWRVLQYGIKYGQTSKYLNTTSIVPGGSSLYRTSALKEIEITTPGLIIEDFNMTFQIHHKRLGRIAFDPRAYIIDQEPYTLRDYIKQVKRWYVGFWQTVIRHGVWPSIFWLSTTLFTFELMLYSLFVLALPAIVTLFALNSFDPIPLLQFRIYPFGFQQITLSIEQLFLGVFFTDYLLTNVVAWIERKPIMTVYGLGFILLRYVEAAIFLYALPVAIFSKSQGMWISPTRRAMPA